MIKLFPCWLFLFSGDVVIHIFLPQQRAFYNLEEFYGNATPVELPFENQQPFWNENRSRCVPEQLMLNEMQFLADCLCLLCPLIKTATMWSVAEAAAWIGSSNFWLLEVEDSVTWQMVVLWKPYPNVSPVPHNFDWLKITLKLLYDTSIFV